MVSGKTGAPVRKFQTQNLNDLFFSPVEKPKAETKAEASAGAIAARRPPTTLSSSSGHYRLEPVKNYEADKQDVTWNDARSQSPADRGQDPKAVSPARLPIESSSTPSAAASGSTPPVGGSEAASAVSGITIAVAKVATVNEWEDDDEWVDSTKKPAWSAPKASTPIITPLDLKIKELRTEKHLAPKQQSLRPAAASTTEDKLSRFRLHDPSQLEPPPPPEHDSWRRRSVPVQDHSAPAVPARSAEELLKEQKELMAEARRRAAARREREEEAERQRQARIQAHIEELDRKMNEERKLHQEKERARREHFRERDHEREMGTWRKKRDDCSSSPLASARATSHSSQSTKGAAAAAAATAAPGRSQPTPSSARISHANDSTLENSNATIKSDGSSSAQVFSQKLPAQKQHNAAAEASSSMPTLEAASTGSIVSVAAENSKAAKSSTSRKNKQPSIVNSLTPFATTALIVEESRRDGPEYREPPISQGNIVVRFPGSHPPPKFKTKRGPRDRKHN